MGRIVGIDLGTTYSAVAVPEARQDDGFLTLRQCPGHAIILDDFKRRITPSVVAEDSAGEIVVGHAAKGRAGRSPEPIMFAKREMGEEKMWRLGKQGELRPVDVSKHILRYLKQLAEKRLRQPVDEAVITVPAYFSFAAKQMTEKAGELAGLRVAQIAQEPVAAALMYCAGDPRENLTIMTYDLGGGTFDVAIVERRDGLITTQSIRAFDGNRFLGGYDFDKLLAFWIMDQLCASGYDFQLNLQDPADRVIFSKLMVYAERAKIALSDTEHHEILQPNTEITDHRGNEVVIELGLSRGQFEAMIGKQIDETVQLCRRALQEKCQPPLNPDQLDEIVMVGGSSRIPLVSRRLQEEFGRPPKLVEPDLCVALGASILAGSQGQSLQYLKLDPLPSETEAYDLVVSGRLVCGGGLSSVAGCQVTLDADDRSYNSNRTTKDDGRFAFQNVPLGPEAENNFSLKAKSSSGRDLVAHRFAVKQTARVQTVGGLVEAVTNMLAKPIAIQDVDGLKVIAPERTPLPFATIVQAETVAASSRLRIPIYEENTPLNEIVVEGLPTSVAPGSKVEIQIDIQENYQICGRAVVPSAGVEGVVTINIQPRAARSLEELTRAHRALEARADDALAAAGRGVLFGDRRASRLRTLVRECETLLNSRDPNPAVIQDRQDEIESLIRRLGAGWKPDPPREVFDEKTAQVKQLIEQACRQEPRLRERGYEVRLQAICAEAQKACQEQRAADWTGCYERLGNLEDSVQEPLNRQQAAQAPQDPALIKLMLAQQLNGLEHAARAKQEGPAYAQLDQALRDIDPQAPDGMARLSAWYLKFTDLQRRLGAGRPGPDSRGQELIRLQPSQGASPE